MSAALQQAMENETRWGKRASSRVFPVLKKTIYAQYEGEMGNRFNVRIEGTRIKHTDGVGVVGWSDAEL
jgi:hypothetical protein